ncbi:MAG TPA: hypothetical protein VIJ93_13405 [bacterium]
MEEKIENNDWVQHQRFKIIGQVRKIVRFGTGRKTILKVWTSDKLPLQSLEAQETKLHQKWGTK